MILIALMWARISSGPDNFKRLLRGVLFIVRARNDIIKVDFTHTKRTTFPTEMK